MIPSRWLVAALVAAAAFAACTHPTPVASGATHPVADNKSVKAEAQAFLDFYSAAFVELSTVSAEGQWVAGTDVSDAHTAAAVVGNQAYAAFTGNRYVVEKAKALMARASELEPLQVMQLRKILLWAAENPGTIPDVTKRRIEAEGNQRKELDGFVFKMRDEKENERVVSVNEIDERLRNSRDLDERRRAWEASKTSGVALRTGLLELRDLRNRVARELGYESFFDLQVADFGMTRAEMMAMLDRILDDLRPLFRELHAWTKRELAKRYAQPAPRRIPAHWIGNRWAQEWPGLVEGIDLDPLFKKWTPEQVIKSAEDFYVGMGFERLPATFWTKSDLYDLPAGATRKKNTHASAWHIDLRDDVRSLMSVKNDFEWFTTTHHELGHIYYYRSYSRPGVPYLLREGANRAFHEAIGELISLAASQQPYLREVGILGSDTKIDSIQWLLNDAMHSVAFLPFAAGTMSHWEHDFYAGALPADQLNARWWQYVAKYQGVEPPAPRGEAFCDPATKTHINDDPGQYFDYALATVLKFQLHDHIARKILRGDPRSVSYRGNKEVGDFLRKILSAGQTRDWRALLKEATGEELSGRAMLEYYAPLLEWLKKENAGKDTAFD